MPKVGKMKFPYTEQGMKDAANYSKQSGKAMEIEEYGHGGIIPKYRGGGMVRRPMMPGRRRMRPMGPRPRRAMPGKPMPRPMPPIGPGIGVPRVPLYKAGGKVPSVSAMAQRLANLMGYAKGGKVKAKKGKK